MKLFTEVSMLFLGALSVVRTQHTQYVIPFVDYNMTLTGSDYGMPINVTIFFQLTDPDMVKPTINCTATINAYAINMPYFRPCEDPTIAFHFEVRTLCYLSQASDKSPIIQDTPIVRWRNIWEVKIRKSLLWLHDKLVLLLLYPSV